MHRFWSMNTCFLRMKTCLVLYGSIFLWVCILEIVSMLASKAAMLPWCAIPSILGWQAWEACLFLARLLFCAVIFIKYQSPTARFRTDVWCPSVLSTIHAATACRDWQIQGLQFSSSWEIRRGRLIWKKLWGRLRTGAGCHPLPLFTVVLDTGCSPPFVSRLFGKNASASFVSTGRGLITTRFEINSTVTLLLNVIVQPNHLPVFVLCLSCCCLPSRHVAGGRFSPGG